MATWSVLNLQETTKLRLDPEYYEPNNLDLAKKLAAVQPVPIESFAFVTDGIHASPDWVEEGGITYLSAKCVKDNYFVLTNTGQVSQEQNKANPRTQARVGDVLLTTVGTIGNAAVVEENILPANMDRHLGIIRIAPTANVDPYYLATFLNCEFGRFQTLREATGNVQLNLFIDKIKKLLVPIGDEFNEIGILTRKAYDKRHESEYLYAEVENFLLQELGLDNLDLSWHTNFIANFSDINKVERLDAEYWGIHYRNLINHIKQQPHYLLGKIASFSNGATPKGAEYLEDGIPFLRIQNINKNRLELDDVVYIDQKIHDGLLKRSQLKPRDVLITITGRIGTAAVIPDSMPVANMNQHSVRLRLMQKPINPYFLSVFLNSQAGLLQTERESYGSTRDALPYYCLERIIIPDVPESLQDEIEDGIKNAEDALQQSIALLQKAKHRVEQLIGVEGML